MGGARATSPSRHDVIYPWQLKLSKGFRVVKVSMARWPPGTNDDKDRENFGFNRILGCFDLRFLSTFVEMLHLCFTPLFGAQMSYFVS